MEGTDPIEPGKFQRRLFRAPLFVLVVFWALGRTAEAGERYLIIENPGKLVIYDEYQRMLGPGELSSLGSFVPMRILSPKVLLGDGVTACLKAEFQDLPYYFLLENDGRLSGESRAGRVSRLDASPVNDTVDVLRGEHLLFEASGTSDSRFLSSGERLVRLFRYGTRTYVMRHRTPPVFGWVDFNRGSKDRSWALVTVPPPSASALTARIKENVRSRVRHVNTVLLGLYAYFNRLKRSQLQPPRWSVESAAGAITCTFQTTGRPGSFDESARVLAKDLESAVLGSGLIVVSEPGKIVIRSR